MPDLTPDQAIQTLKGLPEDRQRAILAKLPADVKQGIMAKLTSPSSAPVTPTPSATPPAGLRDTAIHTFDPLSEDKKAALTSKLGEVGGNLATAFANTGLGIGQGIESTFYHPLSAIFNTAQQAIDVLNQTTPDSMLSEQGKAEKQAGIKRLKDQWKSIKDNPDFSLGNILGTIMTAHAAGGAVGPIAKGLKDTVANARSKVVETVTNTGPKVTGKLAKDTQAANDADATKAAQTNADQEAKRQADLREHFEKTQKVKQANAEAESGPERKGALTHGVERLDTEFQNDLKQTAKDVKTKADDKYSTVRDALGPKKDAAGEPIPGSAPTVPSSELANAVKTAESKIEGSSENLKIFRDILSKHPEDDPDFVNYQGTDIPKGHALYDVLKDQGAMGSDTPATFSDLQGYYTELGDKISGGKLPGDVYQAMKSLHESIGKIMQKMADDHKVGPQLKDAQSYYANYMRTFRDPNSPLYKSIKATERGKSIAALAGKDQTGIEALAKYNPELAARANTIRGYQSEARSITSKPKAAKPLPTLPDKTLPVVPEVRTIGTEDIRGAKAKALAERAHDIRKYGHRIVNYGVGLHALWDAFSGRINDLPRDFALGAAGYGAAEAFARLLERPAIREMLTNPTPQDIAQIPSSLRGNLGPMLEAAEKKGVKVSPALTALVGISAKGPKTQKLQQARDHARFAHVAVGPNGHRIGSNDGQTWVDTETGEPVHAQ